MKKENVIKALDKHLTRWGDGDSWKVPLEMGVSVFNKDKNMEPLYAICDDNYDIYIEEDILVVEDLNADCYYAKKRIPLDDIEEISFYQEVIQNLGCYK